MKNREAYVAMNAAYRAFDDALWEEIPGSARYRAINRIVMSLAKELTRMEAAALASSSSQYKAKNGELGQAVADLKWAQGQVKSFSIAAEQAARILAFAASIIPLL